ncbi:MAG: ABC transporter ATP-binding protein, partial [Thermotoga sp.]
MKERDVFQKETVLKVENLTKVFRIGGIRKKKIYAVNGISFEINRKEILALVGESGSGKTTVAKIIARLYKPTSGKIFLESKEIPDKLTKKELLMYRRSIQMIFQDPFSSLNPLYPVRYAVERPIKVHKLAKGKEIKT